MREIKFRAWHNASKEMFYNVSIKDGKWSIQVSKNLQICGKQNIMQFTGLHDNNGKEVYEGDIVKRVILKEKHFKVVWDNKYSCFMGMDIHDDSHDIILSQWELEVIGNIYENPELIEVK